MKIENNKVVSIHYRATDNDGAIVDSNEEFAPLEYLHGYNNILAGLEKALEGGETGQEKQVTLSASDAYGAYDAGKLMVLSLADLAVDAGQLQPGVVVETSDGRVLVVSNATETTVTLDGNHPLAGKALNFRVKIVSVREPLETELQHGHPLAQQKESCGPGCCC